jgi:hypothetical protein
LCLPNRLSISRANSVTYPLFPAFLIDVQERSNIVRVFFDDASIQIASQSRTLPLAPPVIATKFGQCVCSISNCQKNSMTIRIIILAKHKGDRDPWLVSCGPARPRRPRAKRRNHQRGAHQRAQQHSDRSEFILLRQAGTNPQQDAAPDLQFLPAGDAREFKTAPPLKPAGP